MVDLRTAQLASFVAVAEAGHFGAAARVLSLGQSAVSQHVRRLEGEIGVELFARTSRSVALTPAGERLLEGVRPLLHELDGAVAQARAVATGELGTVRIAAGPTARALLVPGIIARLAHRAPGIVVEVTPATSADGIAAVRERAADVALVRDATLREGLEIERLNADPMAVVLPIGHRLATRTAIALSELAGERRVGWGRRGAPDLHDRLTAWMRRAGLDPAPAWELQGVETRIGLVAAGTGYALEWSTYRWLFADRIRFVAVDGECLTGHNVVAWPAVHPAPALPAVLAAAREVAAELQSSAAASSDGSVTGARQTNDSHT